jgi:polyhydroxyalkanoate synthesis regulator phasin
MMNAEELQAIKLLQSQMHEIHTDVSRQLQICWQQVQAARRECADTRDRIEHLIERVQSLERKINALAEAEQTRRDDIQQAIRQILSEGEF